MDARVNDFFNEINEIVPPVTQVRSAGECVWQECFDDTSGYPYYWNMLTNAVTWEMPPEYQAWLNKSKLPNATKHEVDSKKPLFPSAVAPPLATLEENKTISTSNTNDSGSQDIRKIKSLPTYIMDSDHDSQETNTLSKNDSNTNSPLHSNNSKSNSQLNSDTEVQDEVKPTLSFSLLANYGNYSDDENDSQDEDSKIDVALKSEGHSTLFPVTKPIDVNQFTPEVKEEELVAETVQIDVKAFKRKRRIGVHLVNHPKRDSDATNSQKGNIDSVTADSSSTKEGIEDLKKKIGISFIQGDILQPAVGTMPSSNAVVHAAEEKKGDETDTVVDTQTTLKEKLVFLSEGREPMSPVQIMSIQLETLYSAWKLGHLNCEYFTSWIKDISSDLVKLEEDATPEGWNLEWDRQEKRYFYRNKASNECQWEYPQVPPAEVNGEESVLQVGTKEDEDDDAMDICTTPPPMDSATDGSIEVTTICASATDDINHDDKAGESQDLSSVLDSFYSDIAAIETATGAQTDTQEEAKLHALEVPVSGAQPNIIADVKENSTLEPPKKRKKVKMSHGISMKKKGVSQMVEKWKNAQKDLD